MSHAYTCDVCSAGYNGSPQTDYSHGVVFELEPQTALSRGSGREIVLLFRATERGHFSFSQGWHGQNPVALCPGCLRKALKATALSLLFDDKPIAPPLYAPKVVQALGRHLKHARHWMWQKRAAR